MAFGFCEAVFIQQMTDGVCTQDQFVRVGGIAVPREEIQRHRIRATKMEEFCHEFGGFECACHELAACSHSGAADFHIGESAFDRGCRHAVQAEIVFVIAAPHGGAVLRFIPNLPVLNVMMKPFGPALVVVPHDAETYFRPLGVVCWWVREAFHTGVLNAFSESIDNACACGANGRNVFVSQQKIVALRQIWIGFEIRENRVNVHHIRIWKITIVQTREWDTQCLMFRRKIQ